MKRVVGFGLIWILFSGCQHNDDTKPLTVASWSQPITEQTHLLAEEEHGFFEEEGIDLRLVPGSGGGDALTTMLAGQADIAFTDPGAVYSALAQGEDLIIIYTVYPQNVFNVVTLERAGIDEVKDLKEKTIGVYSRASGTYQNLMLLLHEAGLGVEDVDILEVGIANFAPLLHEEVDATAATDTALAAFEFADDEPLNVIELKDYANIPSDFFVVERDTFETSRDELVAFLHAYEKSAQ
ncbi:ABC transporter substrate-binding protein [Geomicrobium sp. JCM 19039]|uniref:ABC transporter substrate-binding protein n=1 Tax=Geomicrobium sp. JCM 19039 TaxID=1460636 RepID=UPI00045F2AED|nr:ABC transporter substrate-binding protein [Geomicrobium sp. JCM 19039]GAK10742.1 hydroxymethylpyrimidine ABC transporter, substrate-binding component [Geomicrobium sp. JCM 19039]